MKVTSSSSSSGIGFSGLLTIVFITLKLLNYITWEWKWVLAPLWVPIVVILTILVLVAIISLITMTYKDYKGKKRKR